jgi:photosystem II stability/assembly factor-like uncharacterized protein
MRQLSALLVALAAISAWAGEIDPRHNSMTYRFVGPDRGGRVTAVAGVPSQPRTFYMGSTGGGVWKTVDGGIRWTNVSDMVREMEPRPEPEAMGDVDPRLVEAGLAKAPATGIPETYRRGGDAFGVAAIGSVAVAPSDPNIVWVGTGSACIRGNISPGDGIYKSTDAGDTWRHMGLPEAGQIGSLAIHPTDPDIVYAAALGHAFGPNPERGVYRTTDGGLSWTLVLHLSDRTGAADLAMDPINPRVLYAAMWQAERKPWTFTSGGEDTGLYKTTDGGTTWVRLEKGLPDGPLGRIGVAVSPSNPSRVWAMVEAEEGGLYRSDDAGASFARVNENRELRQRPWYYTHVTADPLDENTVYVLNVLMWRSHDGGATFRPVPTPHGDNHALWIHPQNSNTMVQGNDGGANVSFDGGRTWSTQTNQPTAEIYRLTVDDQEPYWLYGGQQDNSAVAIPSRSNSGSIDRRHWYAPAGCETATVAVDPRNPDITYGGCYGGTIQRFDRSTGLSQEIMAWPQLAMGHPAEELRYRFQWNAPIRLSPHDPNVLYHCSNHVHRSRDEGHTWEVISPDLSHDDPATQGRAGGPVTFDMTGVEVYGTVFAFEENPRVPGELWAGTDDGRVHLSRDNGATWNEITPPGIPQYATVNAIELSPHLEGRAFLAVHRYRMDDFSPMIYRTNDHGATWTRLTDGTNGIPADHFVRVIREDTERRGLLFAGTEFGMYVSFDDGATWSPFQLNLPVTPITDLRVKNGDLVVATQGRGFWIMDDLAPLRQLMDAPEAPHLFAPSPAVRWVAGGGRDFPGAGTTGINPPNGAVIHFLLPDDFDAEADDATEVTLEIMDADGEVLRSLSSTTAEYRAPNTWLRLFPERATPAKLKVRAGANRWVWNLRLGDAKLVDTAVLWGSASGPRVPPGTYTARLTFGDFTAEKPFDVIWDPRRDDPQEGHEARFALSREIWRAITRSHDGIRTIRSVRTQTEALAGHHGELAERVTALNDELADIEGRLNQVKSKSSQDDCNFPPQIDNQFVSLLSMVESAPGEPPVATRERFAELEVQLDGILGELDAALAEHLPGIEEALTEEPRVVAAPPED